MIVDRAACFLVRTLGAAVVVLSAQACGPSRPPLDVQSIGDPVLIQIHSAMERAIQCAHEDPDHDWHSGWWGNMAINAAGDADRGLCYHWQDLIYTAVIPTVERVGWEVHGLTVNEGFPGEHHAVIVYDPGIVGRDELLLRTECSFVLDAWDRGEADVFVTGDWIENRGRLRAPARIEELEPSELASRLLEDAGGASSRFP
ncbi:MAG: hypothetical protein IT435_11410 [Phycisphaerales bacterium]|nr:hypothetical protein [Phycisphaerales bacterium]